VPRDSSRRPPACWKSCWPRSAAGPAAALVAICGQAQTRRLAGIIASGRGLGIAVLILGEWPDGLTCHVRADGIITATSPPDPGLPGARLQTLSPGEFLAATRRTSLPPGPQPGDRIAAPAGPLPGRQLPGPAPSAASRADSRAPAARPPAHAQTRPVQISVLGPLQITAGGREIGSGLGKARELLAFLTIHGVGGATGEAISEALWPGAPPGQGTRQRNVALRKARELLRGATGLTTPMWITLTAGRYRLDPALTDADLWRFQAALEAARTAGDDQARLAALRQAVACYRGPMADGAGYDWAEPYAETARRRALDAWARIAELLQPSDPEQALAALEAALTHDPYNEHAYQQVMRLQAAQDRPDAVRRTLALLEARLGELNLTPGASTRQLSAALLLTGQPPGGGQQRPSAGPKPATGQHERSPG
jgi:DNA-binding SARP family transcriptional activator